MLPPATRILQIDSVFRSRRSWSFVACLWHQVERELDARRDSVLRSVSRKQSGSVLVSIDDQCVARQEPTSETSNRLSSTLRHRTKEVSQGQSSLLYLTGLCLTEGGRFRPNQTGQVGDRFREVHRLVRHAGVHHAATSSGALLRTRCCAANCFRAQCSSIQGGL